MQPLHCRNLLYITEKPEVGAATPQRAQFVMLVSSEKERERKKRNHQGELQCRLLNLFQG